MREVKAAMDELRDALDETEKQVRELEREKGSLQRSLDDTVHRLEKVQKSSKAMAEEIKTIQAQNQQQRGQSSRSSLESSTKSPGRLASPPPRVGGSGLPIQVHQQGAAKEVDYVYLKNVLLQFLEQKDKKHQMSLVPVLGMLLHFDKKDEQKWTAAIRAA